MLTFSYILSKVVLCLYFKVFSGQFQGTSGMTFIFFLSYSDFFVVFLVYVRKFFSLGFILYVFGK